MDKGLNERGLADVAVDIAPGARVAVDTGVAVEPDVAMGGCAQEDKMITKSVSRNMTVLIVLLLKSLANEFYAGPIALGGFFFFFERTRNNDAKRPIKPRMMHSGTKQAK
jgi:hypothetical protein